MASASWPGLTTMRSLAPCWNLALVDHAYALGARAAGTRAAYRGDPKQGRISTRNRRSSTGLADKRCRGQREPRRVPGSSWAWLARGLKHR